MPRKKKEDADHDRPIQRARLLHNGKGCPNCIPCYSYGHGGGFWCVHMMDFYYTNEVRFNPIFFKKECTVDHWLECPYNDTIIKYKTD